MFNYDTLSTLWPSGTLPPYIPLNESGGRFSPQGTHQHLPRRGHDQRVIAVIGARTYRGFSALSVLTRSAPVPSASLYSLRASSSRCCMLSNFLRLRGVLASCSM